MAFMESIDGVDQLFGLAVGKKCGESYFDETCSCGIVFRVILDVNGDLTEESHSKKITTMC